MFYSPRECLMHNYCLSKQIYTVVFFRALTRLTGSLCVWLAECSVLSLCNVLLCRLDDGLAHWAANGLGSMTRDGGGYSKDPGLLCFQFVLLFWFVTKKRVLVFTVPVEISQGQLCLTENASEITKPFSHRHWAIPPKQRPFFALNNTKIHVIINIQLDFC